MPWNVSALQIQTDRLNVSGQAYIDASLFLQTPLLVDDVATILLNLCLGVGGFDDLSSNVYNLSSNVYNLSGYTYTTVENLSSNVYNLSSFVYTLSQTVDVLNPASVSNAFGYKATENTFAITYLDVSSGPSNSVLLTTDPSDFVPNILAGGLREVLIGYNAGHDTSSAASIADMIAIGSSAGRNLSTGAAISDLTAIGSNAAYNAYSLDKVIAIGKEAAQNAYSVTEGTFVGYQAGSNATSIRLTGIGKGALAGNSGTIVAAIGEGAGGNNTGYGVDAHGFAAAGGNSGQYVVGMGWMAAAGNTGNYVVGVGYQAANANTGNGVNAIGFNAALSNTASNVVAIGQGAAEQNTSSDVVILGTNAGYLNAGQAVVGVGSDALRQNTTAYAVGIGASALYANTGERATGIGYSAGYSNTGSNFIAIGHTAGQSNTGQNVIAIGALAGFGNSLSDAFILYNSKTLTGAEPNATILADLSDNKVGINIPKTTKPEYSLDVCGDIRVSIPPFTFFTVSGTTAENDIKIDVSAQYNGNPISNTDAGVWLVGHYCKLSGNLTQTTVPITNAFTYVSDNIWWAHGEVTGAVSDLCSSTWYFNLMRVGSNFSTYSTTNFSNFTL